MQLTISNNYNAGALAYFCKHITFEDAYRRSHGDTDVERKEMAYRILSALSDVEASLAKAGFDPR